MMMLKVGIASYDEMKARAMAMARGKSRVLPGEPKVWFTSTKPWSKRSLAATANCCASSQSEQ